MRTLALATLALSFSAAAFSATTSFNCELEKYPKEVFTFKMKDLGKKTMTFLTADPNEAYSDVFTTKSKNDMIERMVSTLNAQGGDLRVGEDRIRFFGDGDGIDFVDLVLFKDSGYKIGFARLNFNFGEDKDYSKVTCKIK